MAEQHVHVDPEFETFTCGDPTTPKRSLRTLRPGDFLVFYCGLQEWDAEGGWNRDHRPALGQHLVWVQDPVGVEQQLDLAHQRQRRLLVLARGVVALQGAEAVVVGRSIANCSVDIEAVRVSSGDFYAAVEGRRTVRLVENMQPTPANIQASPTSRSG